MTYNFHSSCKHMHSSLKIVCNKENGGRGGFDVFEVPYITAKITFTHCIQFHNCIPYTDKKSFTFNTQSHVATFFSQTRVYFTLLCRGHFSRITTSIITAIQSVKPFSLMKMRSEIINIYFDTVYHTTAHILCSFYSPFAITTSGFYFRN